MLLPAQHGAVSKHEPQATSFRAAGHSMIRLQEMLLLHSNKILTGL
jgi:hypothetical protein